MYYLHISIIQINFILFMQYIVFICKFLQLKLSSTYLYFNVTAPYICVTGIKKIFKVICVWGISF